MLSGRVLKLQEESALNKLNKTGTNFGWDFQNAYL